MKPSTKSGLHLPPEAICPMYIRFRISQGVRPCNLKVFSKVDRAPIENSGREVVGSGRPRRRSWTPLDHRPAQEPSGPDAMVPPRQRRVMRKASLKVILMMLTTALPGAGDRTPSGAEAGCPLLATAAKDSESDESQHDQRGRTDRLGDGGAREGQGPALQLHRAFGGEVRHG